MKNVDVICIPEIPKVKANKLSLHSMHISYKKMKRISKIRIFEFENSVYSQWRKDDEK